MILGYISNIDMSPEAPVYRYELLMTPQQSIHVNDIQLLTPTGCIDRPNCLFTGLLTFCELLYQEKWRKVQGYNTQNKAVIKLKLYKITQNIKSLIYI